MKYKNGVFLVIFLSVFLINKIHCEEELNNETKLDDHNDTNTNDVNDANNIEISNSVIKSTAPPSPPAREPARLNLGGIAKASNDLRNDISELERAERVNKGFEKMIQFVNIMGQVDSFLNDRTRAVMRRLALLADDEDSDRSGRRRRSSHHRH